ncbi:SDR family oxidoreductase, partial [Bacillus sp. SIMBA_008]|uniref:SDR family oxidoreductase n=1 Tax=Bacillus sp. SIMBA_008 TaxID=3085757 RepID=UPI00397BA0D7
LVLAAEGVRVALLDRDAAALRETASGCREALVLVADVTDESEVRAAVGSAAMTLGRLDAVVCCAGISGPVGTSIEDTDL